MVLYVQLIICAMLILSAYVIKSFGGDFYESASNLYHSYMNATMLVDDKNVY